MDTELDLALLTERLTAFQISRAVDIDEQTAQRIIEHDIHTSELDVTVKQQLQELNNKLMN